MSEQIVTSPVKFLGGYVISFSSNFGFNSSPSTLNVTLISVPGEAVFDSDAPANANGTFHIFDLTSFSPSSNFKFWGVITSVKEKIRDASGVTFEIQMSDPRVAMKGITLVLAPSPGITAGDGRVIDVYKFINEGLEDTNIATTEEGGVDIIDILYVLGFVGGSPPTHGGIPIIQNSSVVSTIWGESYAFSFDGTSLINNNFKITGETISLLDLFQQLADGSAFDFFVEGPSSEAGVHIIDIKTISRQTFDVDISLDDFIQDLDGGASPERVSAAVTGIELREDATGSIVITDRIEFLDGIQRTGTANRHFDVQRIVPSQKGGTPRFFGDPSANIILPHRYRLPLNPLTLEQIDEAGAAVTGYIPEDDELRAALIGMENWLVYLDQVRTQNPPISVTDDPNWFKRRKDYSYSEQDIITDFWDSAGGPGTGTRKVADQGKLIDFQLATYNSDEHTFLRRLKNAHEVIKKYAEETYGRTYIFPERKDAKIQKSAVTREIQITSFSTGTQVKRKFLGGFEYSQAGTDRPDHNISSLAGSVGAGLAEDNFFDDGNGNGRTIAYAYFDGVSQLSVEQSQFFITENPDNIFFVASGLYVKAEVTNGIFKISPVYDVVGTPCVIEDLLATNVINNGNIVGLNLASECNKIISSGTNPEGAPETAIHSFCEDIKNDKITRFKMAAIAKLPDAIYVPYKDNKEVWNTYESDSLGTGPIIFERDESLSPANYFNFAAMDTAGQAKVDKLSSPLKDIETGSVTANGLPERRLGEAIGNNSNITNVSVSFGINGATTTYTLESYIKRYGKLEKVNNDQFKLAISNIRKGIARSNSEALKTGRDKAAIIDDVRKHLLILGRDRAKHINDNQISIGCNKVINIGDPFKRADSSKTSFVGKSHPSGTDLEIFRDTNIPEIVIETDIGEIPAEGWENSYGVDMGTILTAFHMGNSLPSGGPTTFVPGSGTKIISAGDLNIYKPVNVNGAPYDTFGLKQFVDGTKPNEIPASGFNIDSIRGICLRGPIMIAGWGFDTAGNPTYNSEAEKLDFATWKVGPLDARWDDARKVWVAGGGAAGGGGTRWLEYNP